MLSRRVQYVEDALKKSTELSEQIRQSEGTMQQLYEELQFVYADAAVDLCDEQSGDCVAKANEVVVLLYPMSTDATGAVSMRCKSVNPLTGQLSLHDVRIYEPKESEPYRVRRFRVTPLLS